MNKHTPGEWIAETNPEGNILVTTADQSKIIAVIPVIDEPLPLDEAAANARVIKVAPDLYHASYSALKLLRGSGFSDNSETIQDLVNAIRKAEGN